MATDPSNLEKPLFVHPEREYFFDGLPVVHIDGQEGRGIIASTPEVRIALCKSIIALLGEDKPASEDFREEIRSIEAELSEE